MKDFIELAASEKGYSDMEQPEPFRILLMLQNANTSYWAGGLADQPYFLMLEINAAARGQRNHLDKKTAQLQELMK